MVAKSIACALACMAIMCGCADRTPSIAKTAAKPVHSANGDDLWIGWQYPEHLRGHSRLGSVPDGTIVWEASTTDSIEEVLKFYEARSGIGRLARVDASGSMNEDATQPGTRKITFDSGPAAFSRKPGDPITAERTFAIRTNAYFVTAFIRQPQPGGETHITIIYDLTAP